MNTTVSKICLSAAFCWASLAQGQQLKPKLNHMNLGDQPVQVSTIGQTFKEALRTELALNTPKGTRVFHVKPATSIGSATPGVEFFEGTGANNPNDKILIQVRKSELMVNWENIVEGISCTFAPESSVQKAEFKRTIDTELVPKLKQERINWSQFVSSPNHGYQWVDNNAVSRFIGDYKALLTSEKPARNTCDVESTSPVSPLSNARTTESGNVIQKLFRSYMIKPGYIGKRDVYLNLYDYGDVSDYDWGQTVSKIRNSVAGDIDSRWSNLRIIFKEYRANGSLEGFKITSNEFPWPEVNTTSELLTKLDAHLMKFDWIKNGSADNQKHMLLTRNKSIGDAVGSALYSGTVSWANVWTSQSEGFSAPPHEFGHLLSAAHDGSCWYGSAPGWWTWYDDVMSTSSGCEQVCHHTVQANKDKIETRVNETTSCNELLDDVQILPAIKNMDYSEDLYIKSDLTDPRDAKERVKFKGTPITGQLFDGHWSLLGYNNFKVYKVKFPSQTFYQIKITSASFDTYMYLLDKNGNFVAKDDDSGGNRTSKISGDFNADWYYIIVDGYAEQTGSFNLKVRYGWYDQGWRVNAENNEASKPEVNTPYDEPVVTDAGMIYEADFGFGKKTVPEEQTESATYALYPNPTRTRTFSILSTSGQEAPLSFRILDTMGRVLHKGSVSSDAQNIKLPQNIQRGTYLIGIKAKGEDKETVLRLLVAE